MLDIATKVLVTEVPIFAPRIIGITLDTGAPADTKPTKMEVEVDEDYTKTVMIAPRNIPITGLDIIAEPLKKDCIFLPPTILNPLDRREREHINKYRLSNSKRNFKNKTNGLH